MKIGDMNQDQRQAHFEFVRNHGELLRSNLKASANQAQHFLLFTLGGAVAAMLSLMGARRQLLLPSGRSNCRRSMGASEPIRSNPMALLALRYFVIGLILDGFLAAANYEISSRQFKGWLDDSEEFSKGATDHTSISAHLNQTISRFGRLAALYGYGAFLCFILGSVISMVALVPK